MKILVVEDYVPLRSAIVRSLKEAGYAVDEAEDGQKGLWFAQSSDYDLLLLDLMLPRLDGMELLKTLRDKRNDVHVLITSALDSVEQRVEGLDCGADDYLVKPFSPEELLARVRAIIRRKYSKVSPVHTFGDLTIDTNRKRIMRAGTVIDLSGREYQILEYLIVREGQVVSRDSIMQHTYDMNAELGSNIIDVYIGYLRRKTEINGLPRVIHTRRNLGYVFEVLDG